MKIPAYLQQNRYGIYYFRRAIPCDLRAIIGKREFTKSLQTRDPKKAIQLARFVAFQVEFFLGDIKNKMGDKDKTIKTNYSFEINLLPDGTKTTKVEASLDEIKAISNMTPEQISALHGTHNNTTTAANQTPVSSANTSQGSSLSLSELVEQFKADYLAIEGKSLIPNDLTMLNRLIEIVGADIPCSEINIDTGRNVREMICRLPSNPRSFRGQTVQQILSITHQNTLSTASIRTHMSVYNRLFEWAKENDKYFNKNPFKNIKPKNKEKRHQKRDPFTDDDLIKIFGGDYFTNYDKKRHRPHHYWAPLIGLFTGARPAEIGALEVDDIYKIETDSYKQEIYVFDINTHAGQTRVKTDNGIRQIPVHPKLIELGLIDYCTQQRERGKKRLFDYFNWEEKSGYGRYIGEHFTNYLKKIGIHVRIKKVFYSFRHTIATAYERAGLSDSRIELLSGRSSSERQTTGRQYYISPAKADELINDVRKIDYSEQLKFVRAYFDMI